MQKKKWYARIVLILGVLLTILTTVYVKEKVEKINVEHFTFAADQLTLKVEESLTTYALMLRGAAALLMASEHVSRQEWKSYIESLHLKDSLPKIQGVAFNQLVYPHQLDEHIDKVRREGFLDYSVHPEGKRDIYTAIVYIEPFNESNLRAFGYDTFSEPIRQQAMKQARDTGLPSLTQKVKLIQEIDETAQAGIIMYAPVYRKDFPLQTVEQRQKALLGWTSSPYRMNDLMESMLSLWQNNHDKTLYLQIYDGTTTNPTKLLFDNIPKNIASYKESLLRQERVIYFNTQPWLLVFHKTDYYLNYIEVWITLVVGLMISILLYVLTLSIIHTKSTAVSIAKKLTEQMRQSKQLLQESEFRWKFAIEGSGDGIWDWDIQTNVTHYSKRWKEMLGYQEEDILPSFAQWEERLHPDDKAYVLKSLDSYFKRETPTYIVEFRLKCKDDTYKWILGRGIVVSWDKDKKPLRMLGTHTDISEYKNLQEQVNQLAFYDPLTKLPNRRLLSDRLTQAMSVSKRSGYHSALLFLDLDNFKPINDRNGHFAGDKLLIEVARRLKTCVREMDTVARFGGDEFVVILNHLHKNKEKSISQANAIAEKIRQKLASSYLLTLSHDQGQKTIHYSCTASIGIVVFLSHEYKESDILKWADDTMYQAKKNGQNQILFYDFKA